MSHLEVFILAAANLGFRTDFSELKKHSHFSGSRNFRNFSKCVNEALKDLQGIPRHDMRDRKFPLRTPLPKFEIHPQKAL